MFGKYLGQGNNLNGNFVLKYIQGSITNRQAAGNATLDGQVMDANRDAPQIHTNPLPEFSVDAVD